MLTMGQMRQHVQWLIKSDHRTPLMLLKRPSIDDDRTKYSHLAAPVDQNLRKRYRPESPYIVATPICQRQWDIQAWKLLHLNPLHTDHLIKQNRLCQGSRNKLSKVKSQIPHLAREPKLSTWNAGQENSCEDHIEENLATYVGGGPPL